MFQSSPVPEDGCNGTAPAQKAPLRLVSILTRPGGRVQPEPYARSPHRRTVSILTRPGGRVQQLRKNSGICMGFQSSPVPEDGCNHSVGCHDGRDVRFNPHPSRRTGATPTKKGFAPPGQFQSSPVPEDGCNFVPTELTYALMPCFNPHPSRRTGATGDRWF